MSDDPQPGHNPENRDPDDMAVFGIDPDSELEAMDSMGGDELPDPPDPTDCPHCQTGTLHTWLKAALERPNSKPVVRHVTQCDECGARRSVSLQLERGTWTNVPGQAPLGETISGP